MNIRLTARSLVTAGLLLTAALASLLLLTLIVNLSWFDEPLRPELASLRTPQRVSMENNSYALAFGFLAAGGRDPRTAGQEILRAHRDRYEQGQRIALSPQEIEAILGGSKLDASWQSQFESLECNARVDMTCAERLIAEVTEIETPKARLSVLLDRYEDILREMYFEESRERDAYTPFPPYGPLRRVGRLRLAIGYRDDATPELLEKAAEDFEFWVRLLRDSETLATKMVSLAGVQDNLDFLSALMRERALGDDEVRTIRSFVRPFTSEESDIGEAFVVSEARIAVLTEPHPMTAGSSWITRLMIQENATMNEEYLTVFVPMRLRASLSAQEYYRQKAYERLRYDLELLPPPLFNLGGKMARKFSVWSDDVQLYVARVHDQNGRISLALLQAEIEESPDRAVEDVIRSSTHRNPYTADPMEYDPEAQTIGFECLHTVYHPPAPPDVCTFRLGRISD